MPVQKGISTEGSRYEYDDRVSREEIILQITTACPKWTYKRVMEAVETIMDKYKKKRATDNEDETD